MFIQVMKSRGEKKRVTCASADAFLGASTAAQHVLLVLKIFRVIFLLFPMLAECLSCTGTIFPSSDVNLGKIRETQNCTYHVQPCTERRNVLLENILFYGFWIATRFYFTLVKNAGLYPSVKLFLISFASNST